jgi:hypothetical protein
MALWKQPLPPALGPRELRGLPVAGTRARLALAALVTRYLGAAALIGVGAVHAQQYYDAGYRVIPTIGPLFLLTFISATAVGLTLMAPVERIAGPAGPVVLVLAALAGIGMAAGALGALFISESVGLFGFMEFGYRSVIVLSLALEASAVALLGAFLLAAWRLRRAGGRP